MIENAEQFVINNNTTTILEENPEISGTKERAVNLWLMTLFNNYYILCSGIGIQYLCSNECLREQIIKYKDTIVEQYIRVEVDLCIDKWLDPPLIVFLWNTEQTFSNL